MNQGMHMTLECTWVETHTPDNVTATHTTDTYLAVLKA